MIKRKHLMTALAAVLLVGALISGGAGVAAAQDNESDPIDSYLSDEESADESRFDAVMDRIDMIYAGVRGQLARIQAAASDVLGNDRTNSDRATDFKQAVNGNSSTYTQDINDRDAVEVTNSSDVHEVIIAHDDSDPETVYVVGDINTSTDPNTVNSFEALNESEFNATDRSADHTWVLAGQGARNADELVGDIANRMENGDSLDQSYQAELLGQYCGAESLAQADRCDIRSTIWLDQTQEDLRHDAQG